MPTPAGQLNYGKLFWKLPALLLIVLFFLLCTLFMRAIFFRSKERLMSATLSMNKLIGRIAFLLLRANIKILGSVPRDRRFFIVSNHVSYIDPLVLFNSFRAVFVTSVEVRENKLLGPLCVFGGCYFVERRNKFNIKKEIADVGSFLRLGHNVALFPEGTSTNGEDILQFKSAFFQVAVNERVGVLPIVLRYTTINGEKITAQSRDSLYWYGNLDFFTHLFRLLSLESFAVEVRILESIPLAGHNKAELAARAREMIVESYLGVEHG